MVSGLQTGAEIPYENDSYPLYIFFCDRFTRSG